MPDYMATSPDGKEKFQVTLPDGYDMSKLPAGVKLAPMTGYVGKVAPPAPSGDMTARESFMEGVRDPYLGIEQLSRHGAGADDTEMFDAYLRAREQNLGERNVGPISRTVGNLVSPPMLAADAVTGAAGAVSPAARIGASTLGGAAGGAAQPVTGEDFTTDKALQTGAGGLAGAALGGAGNAMSRRSVPTQRELLDAANRAYEAVDTSGTTILSGGASQLHDALRMALEGSSWFHNINAPQTYRMLEQLESNRHLSIGELRKIRESLNKVGGDPEDQAAARYAGRLMDRYMTNVPAHHVLSGDPAADAQLLREAGGNYRGAKRSGALVEDREGVLRRGERQAGVSGAGWNTINTVRQRINAILNSPTERARWEPDELDALERIANGNLLSNSLRQASKLAPTGAVSAVPTLLVGSQQGTAAAAAVGLLGLGAHFAGDAVTKRAVRKLAESIRADTPLGRSQPPPSVGQRLWGAATAGLAPDAGAGLNALSPYFNDPLASP